MRYRRDGFSVESAIAKGRDLPDWFTEEPQLQEGDGFYLSEFWILHTTRPFSGGGYGRIPYPEIERRGEGRHELPPDIFELYSAAMLSMDEAFLLWSRQEFDRTRRQQHEGSGGHGGTAGAAGNRRSYNR